MRRHISAVAAIGTIAVSLSLPPTVHGAVDKCPKSAAKRSNSYWPPEPKGSTFDVVHFGEGHWNEGQGPETMPRLVQDVRAMDPNFVLFSSDMADVGSFDRLLCFRTIMDPLAQNGIPWFNSPGNHDREAIAGPGGVGSGSISVYRDVFTSMPRPWGDAPAPARVVVPKGEPNDGAGASTHYYFDYEFAGKPRLRVVALDNSQHSFTTSDFDQYPRVGAGEKDSSQLAFLERVSADAKGKGLMTWVVMHQPTHDPRDPSNVTAASVNHTMGKGASPDNAAFEAIAQLNEIDGVFLGHIQGNTTYEKGGVDYFVDGGGGGSPYSAGEVGTDTGYYYGYRILRTYPTRKGSAYRTYFVPLVDKVQVTAPRTAKNGATIDLRASVIQPFDPDLPPRLGGAPHEAIEVELRAPDAGRVDSANLPRISYMWQSLNPGILKPVVDKKADPVNDPAFRRTSMTTTGEFEAMRPGTARVAIKVGPYRRIVTVEVTRRGRK